MGKNRSERMENRKGFAGLVDRLRYHEASRQGFGFLLVLVCTLFAVPGESRMIAGFALAVIGQGWRIYAAGVIYKNKQLATTGAYSLVRHPLYLGNFLILAGFTLASGNLGMSPWSCCFFSFFTTPLLFAMKITSLSISSAMTGGPGAERFRRCFPPA